MGAVLAFLGRLPAAAPGRTATTLWAFFVAALAIGAALWLFDLGTGSIAAGIGALYCFALASVAAAIVLPLPLALVSALYVGLAGWLVDMLPLVMLAGTSTVVARWALQVVRERRLPAGGRWIWVPLFLAGWTALGIAVVGTADLKHFLLLLGIQGVASGIVLAVVDQARSLDERVTIATGLATFVVLCSAGVFLQQIGIPVESLQDRDVSDRIEEAYGLDAFSSDTGMIKYVLSSQGGAGDVRKRMARFRERHPDLPEYRVVEPRVRLFDNHIPIQFAGSARPLEGELGELNVSLLYDNVGMTPANTVPRWRSFARNSLTYAGICVAVLPFAFYLLWAGRGRRRWLGRTAVLSCLAGAGFSLARGAWVAILIGIVYLAIDGPIARWRKQIVAATCVGAALLLTAFYLIRYETSPADARAAAQASLTTRTELYEDTVAELTGIHFLLGFGTEVSRTEEGGSVVENRYIPRAGTHSTYLNYLFRTGIPGLVALVVLYVGAGLHARAAAWVRAGNEQLFSGLNAVAVAAVGAHAVILSLYVEPIYTVTISLVMGLAMAGAVDLGAPVIAFRPAARETRVPQ